MNFISRALKTLLSLFALRGKEAKIIEKPVEFPKEEVIEGKEIHDLWDYLKFKPNTQAYHLINVVSFEEWIDMEEIRRRILELFGINYKNERSLYPYLKALTDSNLFETTDIGGRRKWRKKSLFIELKKKEKTPEKKEEIKKEASKEEEKELAAS